MWVTKTAGTNIDLQIRKGDAMANVFSFSSSNNIPYLLNDITVYFRVYAPGNNTPLLTLTEGNGLTKQANNVTVGATINLPTGMYRYELFFDFSNINMVDGPVIDGAFWVRKQTVNITATQSIYVLTTPPQIDVVVTVQNIDQYIPGPPGPPGVLDPNGILDGGLIF